jgi:hypothetical protein
VALNTIKQTSIEPVVSEKKKKCKSLPTAVRWTATTDAKKYSMIIHHVHEQFSSVSAVV